MPAHVAYAAAPGERSRWPNYQEGDFVIRNYAFRSRETLAELKLHYLHKPDEVGVDVFHGVIAVAELKLITHIARTHSARGRSASRVETMARCSSFL